MKQKSKSLIFNNIMTTIDEQLATIPSCEADGTPIEESLNFEMYIDSITDISFKDKVGKQHYPFTKTVAALLVEDELDERNNQPTEEDKLNDKPNSHD